MPDKSDISNSNKYDPAAIEPKWQAAWDKDPALYAAVDNKNPRDNKYYVLVEFPYPSGDGLHVGHVRSYTAQDVVARRARMMGRNVLYPIGWDAFGLPAENYAIKHKIRPQDATAANIATFKRQIKALGISFDWSREINTTDPSYYRWTQWIFLQLLKHDLAYQDEIPINWCPKERIGLANEEVVDGKHERCGTPVEKKVLKQWMLRITKYADRLIEGLKDVDYLPQVEASQINWIGKSHGVTVDFKVADSDETIKVFTTRIDTIFSGTFVVLAPEHPLVAKLATPAQKKDVDVYVAQAAAKSELDRQEEADKTGVFLGVNVVNPANGESIPVWVADFVLARYGTGAIFGDAHDERDVEFATKYAIPLKTSIEPVLTRDDARGMTDFIKKRKIVAVVKNDKNELLTINWGPKLGGRLFIGGTVEGDESAAATAEREVAEETGYTDLELLATGDETFHYKYYAFSKAEAHETDVQFVHFRLKSDRRQDQNLDESEKGNFQVEWISQAQTERDIIEPLHRYAYDKFLLGKTWTGDGILYNSGQFDGLTSAEARDKITAYLAKSGTAEQTTQFKLRDWVFSRQHYWGEPIPVIHCPKCGAVPVPEDQLPVELPVVEHYEPTETGESPLANITDWVNVDCPACHGSAKRETDTMPNWAGSSWYYLRYLDPHNDQAFAAPDKLKYWLPVDLYNGGMEHTTLHLLYSRFWHQFMYDQGFVPTPEPYAMRRSHGMILAADGRKMSKSLGNVINPDDMIAKYGADATRLYEMFMGPYDQAIEWNEDKLAGISRFLNRVWNLATTYLAERPILEPNEKMLEGTNTFDTEIDREMHKTLRKFDNELDKRSFNTAVSTLMECVNFLNDATRQAVILQDRYEDLRKRTLRILVLMLAPLAPFMAEELWQRLGEVESIHLAAWPKYEPALIKDDIVTIMVQVDGKLRGEFAVEAGLNASALETRARMENKQADFTHGADIAKVIAVPNRLVNFVTKQ